jgi:thioredoxin reductase
MAKKENRATNFCYDGEDFPTLVFEEDEFEDEKETAEKYDPNQPRDPKGTSTGGQWTATGAIALERFHELKAKWAKINNDLLLTIDRPDSPEAKKAMDELQEVIKEIHTLEADPGGIEGIGLPGGPLDVVVVGAGPGGLSSAIMAGTEGMDTLVIDGNLNAGGQAKYSSRIENLPGWPIGVTGPHLSQTMIDQAERVGAEIKLGVRVTGLAYDDATGLKTLTLDNGETVSARSVILAGGVEFRSLSFTGSEGPGVVYADGKKLEQLAAGAAAVIIGGSNGAAQAALGVATVAEHVYVLSRSPITKNMSDYQVQALRNNPKVTIIEGDEISALVRDVTGAPKSVLTNGGRTLPASGVGVFVGASPDVKWLPDSILNEGKVKVDADLMTPMRGVFAVGDIREGTAQRIGAAMGDGQMAIKNVWGYFATDWDESEHPRDAEGKFIKKAAKKSNKAWNQLVDAVFALDRANPWFGQTVEHDTPAKKYDPDQPRAPKGDPKGGQWVKGGSSGYPSYDDGHIERYWGNQIAPSVAKAKELYEAGTTKPLGMGEKQELDQWTGDGFEVVNGFLRGTKKPPGNPIGDRYYRAATESHVKWLDSIFTKASLPEPVTVYRGVSLSSWQRMNLQVGSTFSDAGFMSTSLRLGIANRNIGETENLGILEIRLPKGAKAIAVNGHAGVFENEAEVLVNRNAKFKVVSISANGTWGYKAVLEYV